ncbi:unnamed protein product [Phytophthora fragariaefolia]|uniref:Unnamed protein product n=1 Tax=Phytophthora fragariaefolia TaxID=1490495 RepID=A0A9W7CP86_9STRA|nr:unnamed protein product [Phytophthora fragariaefolia]
MTLPDIGTRNYSLTAYYLGDTCDVTPHTVNVVRGEAFPCSNKTCIVSPFAASSGSGQVDRVSTACTSDFLGAMKAFFGSGQFLVEMTFEDTNCNVSFSYGTAFLASRQCVGGYDSSGNLGYHKGYLLDNGSALIKEFSSRACTLNSLSVTTEISGEALATHSCDAHGNRWYSSNDVDTESAAASANGSSPSASGSSHFDASSSSSISSTTDSSSSSTGAVVGIILGIVIVVAAIAALIVIRRRSKEKYENSQARTTNSSAGATPSAAESVNGQRGLWDDDIITAKRIPRDKLKVKKLLSRGAYGEVYAGVFNRQQVAIKVLIPATRTNIPHVNAFLSEAKMMATMEHPRVVALIGVAWDSLSDLCVVLEFMDGGDLRTTLDKYLASNAPVGFDRQKGTIALHVCHALTYLHSLEPPVIHRDLKSRNVLLSKTMEAKLTDFGISRERLDQTMTAGVGTSLWMAPEVMLGERYDVKADIFSFGVLLSELDVHTLPYALTKKSCRESEGRELTDATLLQRVATGSVRVEFSKSNLQSITELGHACVSVNPSDRPSAPQALYKLQVVLAQELQ